MINVVGMVAAIVMPLWNIPLIVRIEQRQSSQDISLPWAFGVLACMFLMLPSALGSADRIFRTFAVVNAVLFSAVVVQVLRYRHPTR